MNASLAALAAGSVIGLGAFVLVAAWRGRLRLNGVSTGAVRGNPRHALVAAAVLVSTWMLTGWTLAAVTIAAVATMASIALARHGKRRDERVVVDAIAVWT